MTNQHICGTASKADTGLTITTLFDDLIVVLGYNLLALEAVKCA
jgi:hypothetical protein